MLNFLEFAIGSDPLSPSSRHVLRTSVQTFTLGGQSKPYLVFEFNRNLGAGNLAFVLQTSSDLMAWNSPDPRLVYVGGKNNGDGTDTVTYRTALPFAQLEEAAFFVRLEVR